MSTVPQYLRSICIAHAAVQALPHVCYHARTALLDYISVFLSSSLPLSLSSCVGSPNLVYIGLHISAPVLCTLFDITSHVRNCFEENIERRQWQQQPCRVFVAEHFPVSPIPPVPPPQHVLKSSRFFEPTLLII